MKTTGESTGENLAHLCGPLEVFWPTSVDHWRKSGPRQEITGGFDPLDLVQYQVPDLDAVQVPDLDLNLVLELFFGTP